jgi:glycosyltransferase involved in cell wall biosynthesis
MATYNGSRFVREQLESILVQLDRDDEVVVVDDASADDTVAVVERLQDPRIRIYRNERNRGVNETFARAIQLATGDLVFLSDQDDVWTPGRLAYMCEPFASPAVKVVAANHSLIDSRGSPLPGSMAPDLEAGFDRRPLANLLGIFRGTRNYFGCAMAFRTSLRDIILPYPSKLECHDIWIALIGILDRSLVHLPQSTLLHRVHGDNASIIQRNLAAKLMARVYLAHQLVAAQRRLANSRPD